MPSLPVYDRLNTVMTLGHRRPLAAASTDGDPAPSRGRGASTRAAEPASWRPSSPSASARSGGVEGVDLSPVMVERASETYHSLVQAHFQVGNVLALPFGDDEFDAATIGFGLRNLSDFVAGFRELARVVHPGGRVVCLELSLPPSRLWGTAVPQRLPPHGTARRRACWVVRARRTSTCPRSLDGLSGPGRPGRVHARSGTGGRALRPHGNRRRVPAPRHRPQRAEEGG